MDGTAQAERLVAAFAAGARGIDALPGWMDKELGHAALRADAEAVRKQLSTRGGVGEPSLAPLKAWIDDFDDGKVARQVVAGVDQAVEKQLTKAATEVVKYVTTGAKPKFVIGIVSFVGGLLAAIFDWGHDIGFALTAAVATGAISAGFVVRAVQYGSRSAANAGRAASEVASTSLREAQTLGHRAEAIIVRDVKPTVTEVLGGAGIVAPPSAAFLGKVRTQASTVVIGSFVAVGVGVAVLLFGVLSGVSEYSDRCLTSRTSFTFTPGVGITTTDAGCGG